MRAYPDTSFLYAFYLKESIPAAAAHSATMREPLALTELLGYEFRQSLRFQVWRHSGNRREGIAAADAQAALMALEADVAGGVAVMHPCDFPEVLRRAEALSQRRTMAQGYRSFDILHVATALHLGAREFLSFDGSQRKLAQAEGMKVKP